MPEETGLCLLVEGLQRHAQPSPWEEVSKFRSTDRENPILEWLICPVLQTAKGANHNPSMCMGMCVNERDINKIEAISFAVNQRALFIKCWYRCPKRRRERQEEKQVRN